MSNLNEHSTEKAGALPDVTQLSVKHLLLLDVVGHDVGDTPGSQGMRKG